jgi:two-component system phosphate regulon sensor histidine kinase PhoR
MKKTFPIIFILIALSIVGILFIQITWLQGLLILSKNQLSDKLSNTYQVLPYNSTTQTLPEANKQMPGLAAFLGA